jgi:hypothetical protein
VVARVIQTSVRGVCGGGGNYNSVAQKKNKSFYEVLTFSSATDDEKMVQ